MSEKIEVSINSPSNSIPKWLDRDFIALHLKKYFNDQTIQIIRFDIQPAMENGFASRIYRVNLTHTRPSEANAVNLHLVIKIPVLDETVLAARLENNLYKKEIEFYSEIMPKINALLAQLNETKQLIAKCYGVCTVNDALLLEDLATKSYCISAVNRGFNSVEAKIVLKKLAAFHAINAVLQQEQPEIFENFKYGLLNPISDANNKFYLTQFDAMIEAITNWPNADQYVPKLRRLRIKFLERGWRTHDAELHHFNTLIHGDPWTDNIMIKYKADRLDSNETKLSVENMIFVDFQYACWTSPAVDLHYFLNTSLEELLRPDQFDDLIAYYHGHLETNLKRLGYKKSIPNLDQFKQQYRDKSFYGFIVSCTVHPILINDNNEITNAAVTLSHDENALKCKQMLFEPPNIQANLRKLIPIYDKMGIFD